MTSLRKPRADSVLRNLPDEVQDELVRRLVDEGEGYAKVKAWLFEEHKVTVSIGAIGNYWYSDCIRFKLTRARAAADGVKEALHAARPDFDRAAAGAIAQRVFELAASPAMDAGELVKLVGALNDTRRIEAKLEEIELSKRRVALLEEKAEADRRLLERAAGEAKSGGLTPATLEEMERRAKIL